jgi:hypothetical protein
MIRLQWRCLDLASWPFSVCRSFFSQLHKRHCVIRERFGYTELSLRLDAGGHRRRRRLKYHRPRSKTSIRSMPAITAKIILRINEPSLTLLSSPVLQRALRANARNAA